jgi:hypothetical protein
MLANEQELGGRGGEAPAMPEAEAVLFAITVEGGPRK